MRASLALALALAASGCGLMTHASDYAVAEPDAGACRACPGDAGELRRPPCPAASAAPDTGARLVFAARRVRFGGAKGEAIDPGLDLDCSMRMPLGTPVLCRSNAVDGGPPVSWAPLPHGVDDTFRQRVLEPLAAASIQAPIDLDALLAKPLDRGERGLLVIVDGWNGTPDDPEVLVSLVPSPGLQASPGPPHWDGTDVWGRYPDPWSTGAPYLAFEEAAAYVSGGTLVVDRRAAGAVGFRITTDEGSFAFLVSDVILMGSLAPGGLTGFTLGGVAALPSLLEAVGDAAGALSGCDPGLKSQIEALLPGLFVGAADMPTDPARDPAAACDGVSLGWTLDAAPARLGAPGVAPPDGACP